MTNYDFNNIKAMLSIVSGVGGKGLYAYTEEQCPTLRNMLGGTLGYAVMTRHLLWLYDIKAEVSTSYLDAWEDMGVDIAWLFGEHAQALYRAKVIQRLKDDKSDT